MNTSLSRKTVIGVLQLEYTMYDYTSVYRLLLMQKLSPSNQM